MRVALWLVAAGMAIGSLGSHAIAQGIDELTGTVTFYSAGSMWKMVGEGDITLGTSTKPFPFTGYIFDGEKRVALIQWGRYVSMRVPAGTHIFSASVNAHHPAANAMQSVNVEPGKSYFVRLQMRRYGFFGVGEFVGQIATVPCERVFKEAPNSVPVKPQKVEKDFRDSLVNLSYLAKCSSNQSPSIPATWTLDY